MASKLLEWLVHHQQDMVGCQRVWKLLVSCSREIVAELILVAWKRSNERCAGSCDLHLPPRPCSNRCLIWRTWVNLPVCQARVDENSRRMILELVDDRIHRRGSTQH
jgi:hypothetical protein